MPVTEQKEWIVVLECTRTRGGVGRHELSCVMESLTDLRPTGLPGPDRYALQMHVVTPTAPDAVRRATRYWEEALTGLGLPQADVVRAEVLTLPEFEWECERGLATIATSDDAPHLRSGTINEHALSDILKDRATGLVAWDLLRHHLEYVVASSPSNQRHALLLVDVRREGLSLAEDEVHAVAQGLGRLLRSADIVARVEASRFAVLLEDTSEEVAAAVARRLAAGVPTHAVAPVHVTVGFVVSEPGDEGSTLLAHCAAALAHARRSGSPQRFDRLGGR